MQTPFPGEGTLNKLVAAAPTFKDATVAATSAATWTARFHVHTAGWEQKGPFHIRAQGLFCLIRS